MNKFKTYLLIAIFSLMSFVAGLTISEAKANINTAPSIQAVQNTQGVSYDYVYVNGTRATGLYKKGDYICIVYSAEQNAYNVKLYCDYKITTHSYSVKTGPTLGIIPFYIPQYLPGITTLKVYQNNLRLFDDINYVVYDNTIRLLDYVTNDGDLFVFEVDTIEKYYL